MEMRSPLRIGEWRADRSTNELRRAGARVRVEPKAMEVLMTLAGRAGQVVSREELLAAVWPGVVVGDEALTQTVIKLRKALGDNPRSPAYIETISKRGYRLIAPVSTEDAGALPPTTAQRIPRWAALLALVVAALAYVSWPALRPAPAPGERVEAFEGLTQTFEGLTQTFEGLTQAFDGLTLTVLPFESVGADPEQGYLAQGISSDLMTDLSRLSGLRLISPAAGPAGSPTAKGARYIVSGSVQRDAANLRVNVRLFDAQTGEQLWSQRFERLFGDLFEIQNEISRAVVEQLPGRIGEAERQRLSKRYTFSPEAYEYFLRAQALFLVRRTQDNRDARILFNKALALDPKFARAYAGLAMTYAMDYRYQASAQSREALQRALELAQTARQIDPGIPEVYWALGFVHTQGRRHDEALRALRKAIELNPSYADAYALMGGIYTYIGEPRRTVPLLRAALRLNPDGAYLYFLLLGRAYLFENDFEQALINLRQALARNPDNLETRLFLTAALVAHGDLVEADWEAEQIRMHEPGFSARAWLDTYPMTSRPQQDRLVSLLARTKL